MMKTMLRSSGAVFLLGILLLLWGCSDDNQVTNPGSSNESEVMEATAEDFGATLAGQNEGMMHTWGGPGGGGPEGSRLPGEGGALDDTTEYDWNGFHVLRIRNYYDINGVWSLVFDPLTSVRVEQKTWINGTVTNQSGRRTVTIDHYDSTVVWGIEPVSEWFTLQGTGWRSVDAEFSSRFHQNNKSLIAVYNWTITDLLIGEDRDAHPYPMSGSIAVTAVITRMHQNPGRDFEQTITLDFVVYFDGTQWAHLVFADGTDYWIDLSNGWCWRDHP